MTRVQNSITACAGPSLALTKYWGKTADGINIPATPSLGITLSPLRSTATVTLTSRIQSITVNGQAQDSKRYTPFFEAAAKLFEHPTGFYAECTNDFPTSAGLASSSSGFAALAFAINAMNSDTLSLKDLSRLARIGSGSAARAVYGGFVTWPAQSDHAVQIHDHHFWPELRVIVCIVEAAPKTMSSRQAMNLVRDTSPYYTGWIQNSTLLHNDALAALEARDLEKLGVTARHSYLQMFGTMLAMSPPLLYWTPVSIQLIQLAQTMREQGIDVWETMDAGPQVKLLCLDSEVDTIMHTIREHIPTVTTLVTQAGPGPCVTPTLQV